MSVIATATIRLGRPEVSSLMPEGHYIVPVRENTETYSSVWSKAFAVFAQLFASAASFISLLLIVGVIAGLIFGIMNIAESASASEVIQVVRTQEVPSSGNSLNY